MPPIGMDGIAPDGTREKQGEKEMTKVGKVKEVCKAVWPLVRVTVSFGCVVSSIVLAHGGNMPHATYMMVSALYLGLDRS